MQGEVRDDLRVFDGTGLSNTLRPQLLEQYCRVKGKRGPAPVVAFGSESVRDKEGTLAELAALSAAGLQPDADGLQTIGERLGYGLELKASPSSVIPFAATTPSGAVTPRRRQRPASLPPGVDGRRVAALKAAKRATLGVVYDALKNSDSPRAVLDADLREGIDIFGGADVIAEEAGAFYEAGQKSVAPPSA